MVQSLFSLMIITMSVNCIHGMAIEQTTQLNQMEKKMDKLITVVQEVVNNITGITNGMTNVYSAFAMIRGFNFVGLGVERWSEDSLVKYCSLTDCVDMCRRQRRLSGDVWNGFVWRFRDDLCVCHKNERGHDDTRLTNRHWLHFRFP